MIALCREHADKADHGTYTDDQLRRLKAEGTGRGQAVRGRFDWMRQDLLSVVGGNAYYKTPVLVRVGGADTVWLNKNRYGELLLNFKMPTLSGELRAEVSDNGWVVQPGDVETIICPPNGRRLDVRYANGDRFQVAFSSVADRDGLLRVLSFIPGLSGGEFEWPLTVVLVSQVASGSSINFTPRKTMVGTNISQGSFISNCQIGMSVGGSFPNL